jgi:pantetheine-phosphate adenylyltransferase
MSGNARAAVYTGVFDPLHFGHVDVIERGARLFDRLIVGVGINPDKKALFSVEERVDLARTVLRSSPNVEVRPFTGLAVRFVHDLGARVMIRGLRTLSDMEYEFTMSLMNLSLDAQIETVFLLANEGFSHISSTLIRQIASFQGDLDKFVPPEIKRALIGRMAQGGPGSDS